MNESEKVANFYIVIIGCGRLGALLANKLSYEGNSVVVVDKNEGTFDGLSPEFSGFKVTGDATEYSVLKESKIDKADIVIAATSVDNVNLMVSQISRKIFNVPCVIARVVERDREDVYRKLDIDTISPVSIAEGQFLKRIKEYGKKDSSGRKE